MRTVQLDGSFEEWRGTARDLLREGVAPENVRFVLPGVSSVLAFEAVAAGNAANQIVIPAGAALRSNSRIAGTCVSDSGFPMPHVPKRFLDLAVKIAAHRDPIRWDLLYRVLWRLQREKNLLKVEVDADVHRLLAMERQVSHDVHKMHAFVRFRKVGDDFIAWHKPEHNVLALAAPHFAERFAVMRWTIMTPDATAHWDPQQRKLSFAPGVSREHAPEGDALEELWKTYYASIFNPARINPTAMRAEMPSKYWSTLPELEMLPQLLQNAGGRVQTMVRTQQMRPGAAMFLPPNNSEQARSLPVLREAVQRCQGCDIYCNATQAVFGMGPEDARMVLVGEQPGDEEDLRGMPFVGPAGQVLNRALEAAGLTREQTYVTNAVKHFKFIPRGKRRLHQSPRLSEIVACKPWLEAELERIRPRITVALGASAAKSLLGANFALMRERGKPLTGPVNGGTVVATVHPSAVLRADGAAVQEELFAYLVDDLRMAASLTLQAA